MTNNRNQIIYVQISLWIEDNPDPPLDEKGRLMREYVDDFANSSFTVEEIAEARRIYRRDHQYPKRNFGFLWDICKRVRAERLSMASALEAWPMFWRIPTMRRQSDHPGLFDRVHPKDTTIEMVLDMWNPPSEETAKRLLKIVQTIGFKGLDTGNEAADRARFVQIYDIIDSRMTDQETWRTPDNLLPEGVKTVAQLAKNIGKETSIDRKQT